MKLTHSQLFIDSLTKPKKLATYRILSIGKVIQYVFLMITVLTAFSFGQFTTTGIGRVFSDETIAAYAKDLQWLVYPIAVIFLFVMNSVILFLQISIYAFAGLLLLKPMNRRGEYRHVWRTTAFAITWATIFTLLASMYPITKTYTTLLSVFVTMLIVILALTKYPILSK